MFRATQSSYLLVYRYGREPWEAAGLRVVVARCIVAWVLVKWLVRSWATTAAGR
jgi:hypothetical protein